MKTETLIPICVREGPTRPEQCRACRFRAGNGEPKEPLVKVVWGKNGSPKRVDCLSFRAKLEE